MPHQLEPHQERVVQEKKELAVKLTALEAFIEESPIFQSLDKREQYRLVRQSIVMNDYLNILNERIFSFSFLPHSS
jgi:hypothetical protein